MPYEERVDREPREDWAIEVVGVRKRFGDTAALEEFSLRVQAGTVCGLLGPNGAGKTTAVRILSTLLRPDAGRVQVAGCDVRADPGSARYRIGLVGQNTLVDEILTGRQNLVMFGKLYHLPAAVAQRRADELLDLFDLTHAANRLVAGYSGGMRRRLDLAGSLIQSPKVLFLDEPTTGLDPRARNDVWTMIRSIVDGGTTALLTTQYLEEADHLADRIVLHRRRSSRRRGHPGRTEGAGGPRPDRDRCAQTHSRRGVPQPHRTPPDRHDPTADLHPGQGVGPMSATTAPTTAPRRRHTGALRDTATLTGRILTHWRQRPVSVLLGFLFPVLMVLMFGYLLGGAMNLPGGDYLDFLIPGMLAMTMLFGLESLVVSVTTDTAKGVTERIRCLPIGTILCWPDAAPPTCSTPWSVWPTWSPPACRSAGPRTAELARPSPRSACCSWLRFALHLGRHLPRAAR